MTIEVCLMKQRVKRAICRSLRQFSYNAIFSIKLTLPTMIKEREHVLREVLSKVLKYVYIRVESLDDLLREIDASFLEGCERDVSRG